MSTNKNTFKYLCFIFIFAILHSCFPRLDRILSFVFLTGCLFFSAHCTGFSKALQKALNIIFAITLSLILACFFPILEQYLTQILGNGKFFTIQPFLRLPALLLCIFFSLVICKFSSVGAKIVFPRWGYLLICFIPAFLYYFLGQMLSLMGVEAMENLLISAQIPGMYTGKIFFLYNESLYTVIKDISIGWSIFCMMKYNQSMRIKALLEMQAKQA